MPRYVQNAVTGLLMPESLAANPLPTPRDGADPAPGPLPPGLVVEQAGRVLVLPGAFGDRPGWVPREPVPDGQVVVVAQSSGGGTVAGLIRQEGSAKGELVPVPPAWMAQVIRRTSPYAHLDRVIFLVPGLGRAEPEAPVPEHYVRQVAGLLGTQAVAVEADNLDGSLAEARAVFDPRPRRWP